MTGQSSAKRPEFMAYVAGYVVALTLTGIAFGLVYWRVFSVQTTVAVVFVLALIQIIVHFRLFLHISLQRSERADLQLVLFSTLIILLMVGGTLVVLANLRGRMMSGAVMTTNGRLEVAMMQNPKETSSSLTGEQPDASPHVPYWHLWTDEQGISHQQRCTLSAFALKGVGGAAPQWNDKQQTASSTVVFTVQPVGWVGDWHENPAPQWIVVLSGRWWIESMDGMRIEQGPGEFSFGEDQNCVEANGRKGHRSGTIGAEPAVLMTVQLHVHPIRAPCHIT